MRILSWGTRVLPHDKLHGFVWARVGLKLKINYWVQPNTRACDDLCWTLDYSYNYYITRDTTMFLAIFKTRLKFKFMYPKNHGGFCTYICLYLNWAYTYKCRYRHVIVHVILSVKIIVLNILRSMVVFALVLVSV